MGILCPLAFPSDSTTKLSFMRDLTPVVDKLTGACVNAAPVFPRKPATVPDIGDTGIMLRISPYPPPNKPS